MNKTESDIILFSVQRLDLCKYTVILILMPGTDFKQAAAGATTDCESCAMLQKHTEKPFYSLIANAFYIAS